LQKRISSNIDLIASLLEKRCAQNGNYIEGLKNDKIALKLVAFLRIQIQGKESFDLAQRKAFMRKLSSFLQVYKRGDYNELVELEKQYVNSSEYDVETNTDVQGRSCKNIPYFLFKKTKKISEFYIQIHAHNELTALYYSNQKYI